MSTKRKQPPPQTIHPSSHRHKRQHVASGQQPQQQQVQQQTSTTSAMPQTKQQELKQQQSAQQGKRPRQQHQAGATSGLQGGTQQHDGKLQQNRNNKGTQQHKQKQQQQQQQQGQAQEAPVRGGQQQGQRQKVRQMGTHKQQKPQNKQHKPEAAAASDGTAAAAAAAPQRAGRQRHVPLPAQAPWKQAKKAAAADAGAAASTAAAPGALSSNWLALKQQQQQRRQEAPPLDPAAAAAIAARHKRKQRKQQEAAAAAAAAAPATKSLGTGQQLTPVVAMDCEMVGVGPGGTRSIVARVSLVNNEGNVLMDTFVAASEHVTDYRTAVSGVRPADLVGAPSFTEVQAQVSEMLEGRVLVGHSVKHDLEVLLLGHPAKMLRDTARYPPFMFIKNGTKRSRSLKQLAKAELGLVIQEGSHSSVDDARAALYLYHKHRKAWERALTQPQGLRKLGYGARAMAGASKTAKSKMAAVAARDVRLDPLADL